MKPDDKNYRKKIESLPLSGKTKKEIIALLGDEFNFYPDSIWSYVVSKKWYGRNKILYIEFENEIVIRKFTKITYGKI